MCNATSNIANVIMLPKDLDALNLRYYRRTHRLLLLTGIWAAQNWLDRLVRSFIVNVTLAVAFFFQICQFYASDFEIGSIIKELQHFIMFLLVVVSYYSTILQFSFVKKIYARMVHDWKRFSDEEEVFIMKKYANYSNQFVLFITLMGYIPFTFLVLPSAFHVILYAVRLRNDTQLIFPVPIKFFFHFENYFLLALTSEYFCLWVIATLIVTTYSSFMVIISHGCALLRLVSFKIDQPFKKVSSDWSSSEKYDAYEWIKEIVIRYENAIEFIDMINNLTEKTYIIEIFLGIFLIIIDVLYFFQTLQMMQSAVFELIQCGTYVGATLFVIYFNCYIGQKLMDHGTEVLERFYQVSLYELPLRCQKVLPLLIMRSMKPCVISIGGLFVSSNDFFAQFINTSVSYAMVCYNMR